MIVRIENLDFDRCKAEYEESILEDLDWLGVPYQKPVLRQSDRMDAYRCALDRYRHFPQLDDSSSLRKHAYALPIDDIDPVATVRYTYLRC